MLKSKTWKMLDFILFTLSHTIPLSTYHLHPNANPQINLSDLELKLHPPINLTNIGLKNDLHRRVIQYLQLIGVTGIDYKLLGFVKVYDWGNSGKGLLLIGFSLENYVGW